jgi:tetratricopeptide (TPR) repeat protein
VSPSPLDEAVRLKQAGRLDEAVIALEGVLSQAPASFPALIQLAEVQLRRGRVAEAEAALDRAEAVVGTTSRTASLRGDIHYKARRWAEAARSYHDADALGDKGTWSLCRLAQCRLRLKDVDGARGAASRAAERGPESAQPWVVLGDVALREGCLDEAEAMYAKAHERDPADQWAYHKLVEARVLKLPEGERAREVEVLIKTTSGDNRHLVGLLARLRSQRGDNAAAAKAWGRRARDGDLFARKQEGFQLRKAGRLEEAAAVLAPCLLADPEDQYVFRSYVSIQRERGALDELRATLEAALPRAGRRQGAYYGAMRKLPVADPQPVPDVPDAPDVPDVPGASDTQGG